MSDQKPPKKAAQPALDAAQTIDDDFATRIVQRLLNYGLDGIGPFAAATEFADSARGAGGNAETAIKTVIRRSVGRGAAGGFVTGIGGFATMAVAMPANVLEFYVQAARMVGAIAHLRGYDVTDDQVRSAILLTLVGSEADTITSKAGLATGGGRLASMASERLPASVLMIINKAVGFRILKTYGGQLASRLGRGVPLVGGAVGAGIDGVMMKKIADKALVEFPVRR